jgi:hypothetical protein
VRCRELPALVVAREGAVESWPFPDWAGTAASGTQKERARQEERERERRYSLDKLSD